MLLKITIWAFALLWVFPAFAQKEQQDLDSLYAILKRSPSFKEQIVGEKADKYLALYIKLKKEIKPVISDSELFRKLSELIIPINDNHMDFYQVGNYNFKLENLNDEKYMRSYKASAAYLQGPRSQLNLVQLEKALALKDSNVVEGIYFNNDNELKVGIRKNISSGLFEGIVLSSEAASWEPSEIIFYLQDKGNNDFYFWGSSYVTKSFYFNRSERFSAGELLGSKFKKFPKLTRFNSIPLNPPYFLKNIDSTIQYLKLSDFQVNEANKTAAKNFYNKIKDSLTAPNLIVDLRNHKGGYYSVSSQFLNLLRRYVNPGKVYAIINYNTVSNAEQFTIKLKSLKDVVLLGERTMGRITYGHNYGRTYTLPSGKFIIKPTDLSGEKIDYKYEGVGIEPDVYLDLKKDWIEQVKVIIHQKN